MKILSVILIAMLPLAGCSWLNTQYNTQSAFPSNATLSADCSAGLAQTPPIRNNACDIDQVLTTLCSLQSMLPANFGIGDACTAAGFPTSLPNMTAKSVAAAAPEK